jgi:hypothetical protein
MMLALFAQAMQARLSLLQDGFLVVEIMAE